MHPIVSTTLETERLILKKPHIDDWPFYHEYYSDPEAVKYTIRTPLEEPWTWRMVCTLIGHWTVRGYGIYSVREKESGKVIGGIGFWYPIDWPSPEIKYSLISEHQGKGFATEAATAVLAEGAKSIPDVHFISLVHRDNTASRKLSERLGATLEEELDFRGEPHVIYRHTRIT